MESENPKLASPFGIVVDLVLTAIFFLCFTFFVLPSHVPVYDPFWNRVFSAFCAFPITVTFWFAAGYLRVTMVDELRNSKKA